MLVCQVNRSDNRGSRFNGMYARPYLEERGVRTVHLTWEKNTSDSQVTRMLPFPGSRKYFRRLARIEAEQSIQSLSQQYVYALPLHRTFRRADVIHYHLINDGYFSIRALPFLSALKPSVWTWHDPWMMTGHCIYPMECGRWRIGCGSCPDLSLPFSLKHDRTGYLFDQKYDVVKRSKVDVVLASKWMQRMVDDSPIGRLVRTHIVPFGLDLEQYRPMRGEAARARLGIPRDHVVIFVRAINNKFKGVHQFIEALEKLDTKAKLCILSVQDIGLFDRFMGRFRLVELDWTDDDSVMVDCFTAADIFAMPSHAEAFGMMAIEAMACGKPVVVCEGTSLPEVVFAPDIGIAVPQGDSDHLANVLKGLIENGNERLLRGERAREAAVQHYDIRQHATKLADVYAEVSERRRERQSADLAAD